MKHTKLILPLIFLMGFGVIASYAQQGVVSAGGEATGSGGTMSFSTGQTDFQFYDAEAGSLHYGLQQVFNHFLLFTWTGNDCTDWMVLVNWNPEQVPLEGHDIIIPADRPHDPILAGQHSVRNLRIHSSASLTIDTEGKLTVEGLLDNQAGIEGLILLSGLIDQNDTIAARTGSLIHNTPGVQAKIFRYVTGGWESWDTGWHLISSPIISQPIESFITTGANNDYDFYGWDEETATWKNYKDSGFEAWNQGLNFTMGQGYLLSYEQTQDGMYFSGEMNVEDIAASGLTQTGGTHSGWHLLGNPFSSALHWNDGNWKPNAIAGTAKIWVESGKSYTDIIEGEIIPSAQGFWVQVDGPENSLIIPSASRTHSEQPWYKNQGLAEIRLRASEQNGHSFQESRLVVNPEASSNFDFYQDSRFMAGYAPYFYSVKDSEKLSTISLPYISEEMVIPYGFIKNASGDFRIELVEGIPNTPVYLYDLKGNVEHRLDYDGPYVFNSTDSDDPMRFELRFVATEPTAIHEPPDESNVWFYKNTLYVKTDTEHLGLILLDMRGRHLRSFHPGSGEHAYPLDLPPGIYVVHISEKQSTRYLKFVIP